MFSTYYFFDIFDLHQHRQEILLPIVTFFRSDFCWMYGCDHITHHYTLTLSPQVEVVSNLDLSKLRSVFEHFFSLVIFLLIIGLFSCTLWLIAIGYPLPSNKNLYPISTRFSILFVVVCTKPFFYISFIINLAVYLCVLNKTLLLRAKVVSVWRWFNSLSWIFGKFSYCLKS